MQRKKRSVGVLSLLVILAVLLAACGAQQPAPSQPAPQPAPAQPAPQPAPSQPAAQEPAKPADPKAAAVLPAPKKVKLGVIPGTQDMVITYMVEQGFHKKYNLDLDITKMLNPAALHTAIAEKQVDIGFGGYATMALARHQGKGMLIFNFLVSPSNLVLAPKDSPVNSLADLKGKKWGNFGGPSATTTQITQAVAKVVHGVNLSTEAEEVSAPAAALFGLLDNGEVDAALFGTIDSIKGELSGKYKVIADIAGEWEAKFGGLPAHVAMTTNDDYAAANPDVLIAFSAAYQDTMNYIQNSDEVWVDYAKRVEIDDPRAPQLLKQRFGSRFITKWDEQQRESQIKLLEELIQIVGTDRLFPQIPEGLMRVDLQPGR